MFVLVRYCKSFCVLSLQRTHVLRCMTVLACSFFYTCECMCCCLVLQVVNVLMRARFSGMCAVNVCWECEYVIDGSHQHQTIIFYATPSASISLSFLWRSHHCSCFRLLSLTTFRAMSAEGFQPMDIDSVAKVSLPGDVDVLEGSPVDPSLDSVAMDCDGGSGTLVPFPIQEDGKQQGNEGAKASAGNPAGGCIDAALPAAVNDAAGDDWPVGGDPAVDDAGDQTGAKKRFKFPKGWTDEHQKGQVRAFQTYFKYAKSVASLQGPEHKMPLRMIYEDPLIDEFHKRLSAILRKLPQDKAVELLSQVDWSQDESIEFVNDEKEPFFRTKSVLHKEQYKSFSTLPGLLRDKLWEIIQAKHDSVVDEHGEAHHDKIRLTAVQDELRVNGMCYGWDAEGLHNFFSQGHIPNITSKYHTWRGESTWWLQWNYAPLLTEMKGAWEAEIALQAEQAAIADKQSGGEAKKDRGGDKSTRGKNDDKAASSSQDTSGGWQNWG